MDMSEEARTARRPSTASILFFGLLAILGLLGASRAGGTPSTRSMSGQMAPR